MASDLLTILAAAIWLAFLLALGVNELFAARGTPRRQGFMVSTRDKHG